MQPLNEVTNYFIVLEVDIMQIYLNLLVVRHVFFAFLEFQAIDTHFSTP